MVLVIRQFITAKGFICRYCRFTFFRGENIFVYKRKFENYFYEILLLNEILVKYISNTKIFSPKNLLYEN